MSHRQFQKWVIFARLHNIDSRERNDRAIARLCYLVSAAMGGKAEESAFDPLRFKPSESKRKHASVKKKTRAPGLDPAVLAAFGNSDPKPK